jgi:hypothetical protein
MSAVSKFMNKIPDALKLDIPQMNMKVLRQEIKIQPLNNYSIYRVGGNKGPQYVDFQLKTEGDSIVWADMKSLQVHLKVALTDFTAGDASLGDTWAGVIPSGTSSITTVNGTGDSINNYLGSSIVQTNNICLVENIHSAFDRIQLMNGNLTTIEDLSNYPYVANHIMLNDKHFSSRNNYDRVASGARVVSECTQSLPNQVGQQVDQHLPLCQEYNTKFRASMRTKTWTAGTYVGVLDDQYYKMVAATTGDNTLTDSHIDLTTLNGSNFFEKNAHFNIDSASYDKARADLFAPLQSFSFQPLFGLIRQGKCVPIDRNGIIIRLYFNQKVSGPNGWTNGGWSIVSIARATGIAPTNSLAAVPNAAYTNGWNAYMTNLELTVSAYSIEDEQMNAIMKNNIKNCCWYGNSFYSQKQILDTGVYGEQQFSIQQKMTDCQAVHLYPQNYTKTQMPYLCYPLEGQTLSGRTLSANSYSMNYMSNFLESHANLVKYFQVYNMSNNTYYPPYQINAWDNSMVLRNIREALRQDDDDDEMALCISGQSFQSPFIHNGLTMSTGPSGIAETGITRVKGNGNNKFFVSVPLRNPIIDDAVGNSGVEVETGIVCRVNIAQRQFIEKYAADNTTSNRITAGQYTLTEVEGAPVSSENTVSINNEGSNTFLIDANGIPSQLNANGITSGVLQQKAAYFNPSKQIQVSLAFLLEHKVVYGYNENGLYALH